MVGHVVSPSDIWSEGDAPGAERGSFQLQLGNRNILYVGIYKFISINTHISIHEYICV